MRPRGKNLETTRSAKPRNDLSVRSDWLRKWRVFSRPITKRIKAKPEQPWTTFVNLLKIFATTEIAAAVTPFIFSLQYLLVRQPLLAILFLVVLFFGVAMTGFSLFHFYLVLTNQTTNEFYKRHYYGKSHPKLSRQSKIVSSQTEKTMIRTTRRRTLTRNKETSSRTSTNDVVATEKLPSPRTSTPYYIGIWRNITEVMRVWLRKKRKIWERLWDGFFSAARRGRINATCMCSL